MFYLWNTSPAPGRSIHVLGKNRYLFSENQNSHGCRLATVDIAIFPKSRLFKLCARKKISEKLSWALRSIHLLFFQKLKNRGKFGKKSLKSHKRIPYTHRWESENNTFQNMPHIFTGLENAFTGPVWSWKYHKSKVYTFLHPNYIQRNFLNSEKKYFFARSKFFSKKIENFWSEKFLSAKSKKVQNVEISKI